MNLKKRKQETTFEMKPCYSEMDNHVDTICFGKNFRVIHFTSEVCLVSPFLSEYNEQEDIPLCTAATVYDFEDGETVILKFG